ncbi:MAG: hypothetical protein KDA69_14635 [Planctomycetaceae bacterium]|nr:hypothetical protein [Planctomycetaceae bacterium]MCB9953275.1 hypothetical protein [Planctomycetaceae bacterium]
MSRTELLKIRLALAAGIIFAVSCFYSLTELNYLMFAHRAQGVINDVQVVPFEGRQYRHTSDPSNRLVLQFSYPDASGAEFPGTATTEYGRNFVVGQAVTIQYFQGDESSARIAGLQSMIPIYIVVASVAFAGFMIWQLAREANSPILKSRRS